MLKFKNVICLMLFCLALAACSGSSSSHDLKSPCAGADSDNPWSPCTRRAPSQNSF